MKKCILCNAEDKTGLINNMCTECFDLSLDVGKDTPDKKKKMKKLKERRIQNNYKPV